MKKIIIFIIGLIVISTIIFFVGFDLLNYTTNSSEVKFSIEEGDTVKNVSIKLKENDIINSSEYMIVLTKIKGLETKLQVGEYTIKPKTKMEDLLEQFQNPDNKYIKVTIPEGYTFYQIAQKLYDYKLVDKNKFLNIDLELLPNDIKINENQYVFYPIEGYLFPDTYFIDIGTSEEEIIKIMYDEFLDVFNDEYIKRARELDYSINEILTIASLIEKEAYNDEERSRVAGVIYNRLNIGMLLQIDASVAYGITEGEKSIERLFYKDLEVDTKYNTYLYNGLPPGPISSPGKASIKAALYPEEHDYLYYVLGDSGHLFSKTYEEHLKNKRKMESN